MSKKMKKKSAEQGTYALCITIGLIIGVGFGALADNLLILTVTGAAAGAAIAYYVNRSKRAGRH